MDVMPIERIPDWEKRLERQDAFWQNEVLDRPVVHITLPRENEEYPFPEEKEWDNLREKWFDTEYVAEQALAGVMNARYMGDALPKAYPNLGPEVFSAFFGLEMEYGERTSWSEPVLDSWDDVDDLQFTRDNVYWSRLEEMTEALLDIGENKFYTGLTDLHPGGDAIAAFRDPAALAMDMIEYPDEIKNLLDRVTDAFFETYDYFADKLQDAGQALSTWTGIVSSKRWYIPSNDFSCMVSNEMFEDVFLPGIAEECARLDAAIYHLDGPDALRHLDSLLQIDDLNAIQWVYGAGNGPASEWLEVYKKCQDAGKGVQIGISVNELDTFIEELEPGGVWMGIGDIEDEDHAEHVLEKTKKW